MPQKILVVDDEPDICDILRLNFEMEGYEVETYEEPPTLGNDLPDLILLDVMMTPKSGFEWAMENLSKKPEEMRKVLIPSYTFYNILESDLTSGKVLHIDPYLSEEEAIQSFMEKTSQPEKS